MRMFGTLAVAGITGAAILKILAVLLAPLWTSLAAIFASWLAALGAMMIGWALLGLKIGLMVCAVVLAIKWIKKRTASEEV